MGYGNAILSGILFGYMVLVRPNYIILLPLTIVALFINGVVHLRFIIALIVAFATIGAITIPLTDCLLILPTNGAYNFFAGANSFTSTALIHSYNAEPSIQEALGVVGEQGDCRGLKCLEHNPLKQPEMSTKYRRLAIQYIEQHPLQFLKLAVLKIFTLFRPDYRQVYRSSLAPPILLFAAQTIMALPSLLWGITRLLLLPTHGLWKGALVLPLALMYIVPFALTNADPRLRLPLDIVLMLDVAYCWDSKLSTIGE